MVNTRTACKENLKLRENLGMEVNKKEITYSTKLASLLSMT